MHISIKKWNQNSRLNTTNGILAKIELGLVTTSIAQSALDLLD
jgi:hypothetical protein